MAVTTKNGVQHERPSIGGFRVPYNLEAESGVLGAMLLENEVIPWVQDYVRAEDFYQPAHQVIFATAASVYDTEGILDLRLLIDRLEARNLLEAAGGFMAVASLEQRVFSTGAAPEWAAIVAEKSRLRRLMVAAGELLKSASEEEAKSEQLVDGTAEKLHRVAAERTDLSIRSAKDVGREVLKEALKPKDEAKKRIFTKLVELDSVLGGIRSSDFTVLAARPSVGKTALALQIAARVAAVGDPVLFFTLEMEEQECQQRVLSSESRTYLFKILNNELENEFDRDAVTEAQSRIDKWPLSYNRVPGITATELVRTIKYAARRQKLGLVVVDYLQIMGREDMNPRMNDNQQVGTITRMLRKTCLDPGLPPIILLSQLSRETEKQGREPRLSDLRDSGSIEQDATKVIFLYPGKLGNDGKYISIERQRSQFQEVVFNVAKNRNGEKGKGMLNFDRWTQTFGTIERLKNEMPL